MKRTALIVVLCLSVVFCASADINIAWSAIGGFFTDAGGSQAILNSGNVLVQLIFSASSTYSLATDVGANDYIDTSSDNELLTSFVLSFPGTAGSEWGDFNQPAQLFVGYGTPGSVFARVFQSTAPAAGGWYYNSAMLAVSNYDPLNPSYQELSVNRGGASGDGVYAFAPNNFQVIPEPATMALLGLGGLLMAIRRRKV